MVIHALRLLMPALIPSWRFFDWIAPSPRIEYAFVDSPADPQPQWQALIVRPERVALSAGIGRLFFNANWNDTLFLASLAERISESPDPQSIHLMVQRLLDVVPNPNRSDHLRFRLVFVSPRRSELEGNAPASLQRVVVYESDSHQVASPLGHA